MRKLIALAGCAVLGLAACGGDDASGDDIADQLIQDAEDEGIELDEDCVRDKASQLSDADAEAIADAGEGETPELSPEGEALTLELFECIDDEAFNQSIIDEALTSLPEGVDEDCVRSAMEGVDAAELAQGANSPELMAAITECISGG
jgi:hypothetical protein